MIRLLDAGHGTYAVYRDDEPVGTIRRERRGGRRPWRAIGLTGRQTILPDRRTAARWVAGV